MVSVAAVLIVAPRYCQWMDAQHRATINHHLHRYHHHHYQQTGILPLSCTFGSVGLAETSSGLSKDIKEWTHLHWLSLFTWTCSRSERLPPPFSALPDFLGVMSVATQQTEGGGRGGAVALRRVRSLCLSHPGAAFPPLSRVFRNTLTEWQTVISQTSCLGSAPLEHHGILLFPVPGLDLVWENFNAKENKQMTQKNKKQRLHLCTICQGMWGIYINLYRLHDEIIWNANGVITDFCIIVVIYLHILGGWVYLNDGENIIFHITSFPERFPAR